MIQMAPSQLVSPLSMTQRQGSNALTLASHSPYSSLQTKNASSMSANPGPIQFGSFSFRDSQAACMIAVAVISAPIWVPCYALKITYDHIQGNRGLKNALAKTNNDTDRQGVLKKAITARKNGVAHVKRALNQLSAIQDPTHKGSLLLLALNSVASPKDRIKVFKQVEKLLATLPAGDMRDKLTTITDYRLGKNNSTETFKNSQACEDALKEQFGALVQTTEPETPPQAE
jgi:hypothetical protein